MSVQLFRRQAGLVAACLAVGLLVVLVPTTADVLTLKPVPFIVVLAVLGLTLAREHALGRFRLLSPVTITFAVYAVIFAIVPLADVAYGNVSVYDPGYSYGSWLVVGGAVSLALGFALADGVRPWSRLPSNRGRIDRTGGLWLPGRATWLAILLMVVVYVFVLRATGGPGGIPNLIQEFASRRNFLTLSSLLGRVVSLVPAALALRAMDVIRRPSRRAVITFLLIWTPLALFATGFYGDRFRPLSVLVMVLAFVHFGLRRLPAIVVVVLSALLFALFVYAGIERNVVGTAQQSISLSGSGFYTNYVGATHEFGQFRDFVLTIEGVPTRIPFQYGRTLLKVIPGAPFPTSGSLISRAFYSGLFASGTSIPTPLPGELYLNFAVPGLLVGMALFGLAVGLVESYCARHWHTVEGLAVYALSLLHLPLILRGDWTTFAGTYLIALITLLVASRVVRRMSHRPLVASAGLARYSGRSG